MGLDHFSLEYFKLAIKPHLNYIYRGFLAEFTTASFPRRGELDHVNDFPRQVFRAEFSSLKTRHTQLLSEDPRRIFHAEDRVNGIARKTRRGSRLFDVENSAFLFAAFLTKPQKLF